MALHMERPDARYTAVFYTIFNNLLLSFVMPHSMTVMLSGTNCFPVVALDVFVLPEISGMALYLYYQYFYMYRYTSDQVKPEFRRDFPTLRNFLVISTALSQNSAGIS